MSRKMQRWRKVQSKKKSSRPPLSDTDTCKEVEEPPLSAGATIKRKFHEVATNCDSVSTKHAESNTYQENSSKCKPTKLPEKRILELILDVMQRRDTHEIFAEPVDPTKVEDYYEIIKEPMDFGTMRAKLHEGMYQNLEQFEHDAFLIPKNAMHFNSSGSVYFRQARAIYELAKKVFHVLKTNPGNIEVEFLGTRQRSMRRLQNDAKDTKHSRGVKPHGALDVSSRNIGLGPSVPSAFRRSSNERPSLTENAALIDSVFLLGNRHGQRLSSLEASRRFKYEYNEINSLMCNKNPQSLILMNENASYRESLISFAKDLGPTAQMVANRKLQGNHSLFPSCTTPSLNDGVQPRMPLGFAAFATLQSRSNTGVLPSSQKLSSPTEGLGSVLKSTSDTIYLTNAAKGDEACEIAGMTSQKSPLPEAENSEKKSTKILCYKRNVNKVTRETSKKTQNRSIGRENNLGVSTNVTSKDADASAIKKKGKSSKVEEIKVLPVVLALEQSHSNLSELKCRNKKSSNPPSSRITRSQNKNAESTPFKSSDTGTLPNQSKNNSFGSKQEDKVAKCDQNNNVGSSSSGKCSFLEPFSKSLDLELNKAPPAVSFPSGASSGFIFDMPFLKAQLNKMKPVEQPWQNEMSKLSILQKDYRDRSLHGEGSYNNMGREVNASIFLHDKQKNPSFLYNNQASYHSLGRLDTDLALQL